MKVLHILNSDFGSPRTMGYRAYQIYKNADEDIQIYVFARDNLSDINSSFIKKPFPFYREYSRFSQFIRMLNKNLIQLKIMERKFFDYFAKKYIDKVDIVHFFHHSSCLMEYAKKQGKITIVEAFTHPFYIRKMHEEGLKLDYEEYKIDYDSIKSYELADIIISPSNWVTKTLIFAGISKKKIYQVEYGVHPQPDRVYKKSSILKIAFAGGLKRTKGIIELLKAANILKDYDIEFNIYGRIYNDVKEEIKKLKTSKTNFHGFTQDIISAYKKNDIYVYPTYFEGSSKTVFEAMSCGLPVITTENAGSIIRDGIDGFIIPVNDVSALVQKIRYFYYNRDKIAEMGKEAQNHSRKFTWKKYAKRVNKIYREVINGFKN